MKSLIIVRHAKSSWDTPLDDKKRPLIDGGRQAIKKVGQIAQELITADYEVWSSTAVRATETALIFCESVGISPSKIQFEDSLYTFNESQLEKEIKKCSNKKNKLILFGHNEAITNFVNKFGDETIFNVPTAGLVFLQFDVKNWEDINKGRTIKKIFPKEI
ncbi:histidine phosphatase family protein [Flavobacterium amnicola]|uniref:Histidine phosphatase family protein n=1 Tax=Flavobacterium amnicola TaxID=2506422 RepID=A0A4Q1K1Y7_9FLAO|nr:histidine phosphatase family protein [Flavobacterium amnicola]RXR18895.1 histidine phosphatase family protein [Flavobacterium amnicola]